MRFTAVGLFALALAGSADASDGVLEINQACAVQSGCFVGDSPGYPVTISAPGSYQLTGNLAIPTNTTAIRIGAENVTLDLGGFEVKGPNTCTGLPTTACGATGGAAGILGPTANEFLAVVRNGRVLGMAGACVDLQGNSSSVSGVTTYYCGGTGEVSFAPAGIRVGLFGRVSGSHVSNALGVGIMVGDGGAADDNEVRGVQAIGIMMAINQTHGGRMSNNRVYDNGALGLYAFGAGRVLATKNVLIGNATGPYSGAIIPIGDNICNSTGLPTC